MYKKGYLAAIFYVLSSVFTAYSQNSFTPNIPAGLDLSNHIKKTLTSAGFSVSTQELTPTAQDKFAENLILDFSSTQKNEFADEEKSRLIIDITQEDFYRKQDQVLEFIKAVKETDSVLNVTFLFSALTSSPLYGFSRISGSDIFASDIDQEETSFAITIDFDSAKENTIKTGCLNATTPLWLCRKLTDAFISCGSDFNFPNVISSLYRLGLIRGEKRLIEYVRNEIPAISVSLCSTEELKAIQTFIKNYTPEGSQEWDQHYFFIPQAHKFNSFYLNERVCLIFCIVLAVITLLLLCTISFKGARGEQNKYELLKNLYVIPLTISVSMAGIFLAQKIFSPFTSGFNINPVMQFGLKILLAMTFISILYAFHNLLRIPTDIYIYSYIIQFICLFNVFIFSSKDLMLFIPFVCEYMIIYFSRKYRSMQALIITFILMTVPFIPYAYVILKHGKTIELTLAIFSSFSGNLMLALALFPFQLLWLKILTKLEIYNKNKGYSYKKIILNGCISTFSILSFTLLIMILSSTMINKNNSQEFSNLKIIESQKKNLKVNLTKNEFSGMNTNHIKINSGEKAIRYTVTVTAEDEKIPVYDSIYQYEILTDQHNDAEKNERINFIIPDYPPQTITIDYAADPSCQARIEATAYYASKDKNTILKESQIIKTAGKN